MAMSDQLKSRPLYPLATALGAQYMGGWVGLSVGLFLCRREQMSPLHAQSLYRHSSIGFVSRLLEITWRPLLKRHQSWHARVTFQDAI